MKGGAMISAHETERAPRWTLPRVLAVGAGGGMVAGMMMAAVEMLYGWVSSAHTAWDAPMAIWSYVAGLEHFGRPANHVGPIVLGMGGHMTNAMVVGVVFAGAMALVRPRGDLAPVMIGVAYGLALWALMRYVLLPIHSPEDRLFTADAVSPQWVWWVAHAALGMTAGVVYDVARRLGRPERTTPTAHDQLRAAA